MTQATVIARQTERPRWWRAGVVAYAVVMPMSFAGNVRAPVWVIVVAGLVGVGLVVPLSRALTPQTLEVTDRELIVRRPFRPQVIRRDAIVAVHGDIPNRPTWSVQVQLETTDGTITLPPFGVPSLTTIIESLQEWSGTGEAEPAPARSRPSP